MYNLKLAKKEFNLFLIEKNLINFNPINLIEKINLNISEKTSYTTNVKGKMTDWKFFVKDKEINDIFNQCFDILNWLPIKRSFLESCWGNELNLNEFVKEHDHHMASVSGLIYLTENGPGTFFNDFNITVEEKIGKILFFSPLAKHSVLPSNLNKSRYTISFNFQALENFN